MPFGSYPIRRLRAMTLPEAEKLRRSHNRVVTVGSERILLNDAVICGAFFYRVPRVIVEVRGTLEHETRKQ